MTKCSSAKTSEKNSFGETRNDVTLMCDIERRGQVSVKMVHSNSIVSADSYSVPHDTLPHGPSIFFVLTLF